MTRDELLEAVIGADALISLLRDRVDDELLEAGPGLRVIANCAVGYDNVDIAAATRRGIPVTNTPDVLTEATADFAFALLLAAARRVVEGDRWVRSGTWTGWEPQQLLGAPVGGATIGIVGFGRIGQAVARRARGFAMEVLYADPHEMPAAQELEARRVSMDELLAGSDFVTLHCSLSPQTRHIIDAAALAKMRPTAILVNTARGACVDEDALVRALADGTIGGAGLDVFEREPEVVPELLTSDRVVLAPHAGSATTTTRARMAEICACAVRDALSGRRPETVVNPEIYR